MTEINRAIEYFEDAIKESNEIIGECSDDLKSALIKQKEYFAVAITAMKKQTPKHVIQENDFLWCPACERGGNSWDKPKHCMYCGQSLQYNNVVYPG